MYNNTLHRIRTLAVAACLLPLMCCLGSSQSRIISTPSQVEFDTVDIGTTVTKSIVISVFSGVGIATINSARLNSSEFKHFANSQFPITITNTSSITIAVMFTPIIAGDFHDTLLISSQLQGSIVNLPIPIHGYARGLPPVLNKSILSITTHDTTTTSITIFNILLDSISTSLRNTARKWKGTIAFNQTMLVPQQLPVNDSSANGLRYCTFIDSLSQTDTLSSIPFIVTLGDAQYSKVSITSWQWLDSSGAIIPCINILDSTVFAQTDIWKYSGERFVNASSSFLRLAVFVNSTKKELHIAMSNSNGGVEPNYSNTITLYDVLGIKHIQYQILPLELDNGTFTIDISSLVSGMYFCRLSSNNNTIVRPFMIP